MATTTVLYTDPLSNITSTTSPRRDPNPKCDPTPDPCKPGLFLPIWMPQDGVSKGDMIARAAVYLIALLYMFLGVSIIADRFMAAIEVITSKEKTVIVKKITGQEYRILVRVWNETVSNLTLMALGSSAPEILLSIIEIVGNDFNAGALGPGTIVGSAAFNMFVIIAICIISIPDGESRNIYHIYVFWVTLTWSIFAYIWLYLILAVISPNVVDLWEGLVTFFFFPLTVISAYLADRKLFGIFGKRYMERRNTTAFYGAKSMQPGSSGENMITGKGDIEMKIKSPTSVEAIEFERHRGEFIEIFKRMRAEHPDTPIDVLEQMAEQEVLMKGPKSRAFYRIQATRKLIGAGDVVNKRYKQMEVAKNKKINDSKVPLDYGVIKVSFDPGHYTCLENIGTVYVTVGLDKNGVETAGTVLVDYKTFDGTATQHNDYTPTEGTLEFGPDEDHKKIGIPIIDNDLYEEDEFFYVKLSHARAKGIRIPVKLVTPMSATVMIIDNDHAGAFGFENQVYEVSEAAEEARINVIRSRGARGAVRVPYKTVDGTATAGQDYKHTEGVLYFKDEQSIAEIVVEIMNDEEYEKKEDFTIELGQPISDEDGDNHSLASLQSRILEKKRKEKAGAPVNSPVKDTSEMTEEEIAQLGKPVLAEISKCKVMIQESKEFKGFVDKLLMSANTSIVVGSSSWKQQFTEALSVQGAGDEGAEPSRPSCFEYFMHGLTLPWKLLFALVPPTNYFGGWLCFVCSISVIGLMTAVIGDLASHFGCQIGLKDAVTAISLVALGTSVPDTFASKVAAVQDNHADSSIGNVTGSNAVNVYLGIGVAWALAAIVHKIRGTIFKVEAGTLAFSVTLFCIGAILCTVMLQIRRHTQGGELGGGKVSKWIFGLMFLFIWFAYVTLSSLQIYCHIDPGF